MTLRELGQGGDFSDAGVRLGYEKDELPIPVGTRSQGGSLHF